MRSRFLRALLVCAVVLSVLLLSRESGVSALSNAGNMNALDVAVTENFDTLAGSGTGNTWLDNTTIAGWYASRSTYNAGTGSSNAGALYSFGASTGPLVSDRALGSVGSTSTNTIYWAVKLTNHTGATITSLDVSYVGEQWRMGGSSGSPAPASVAQTVDFQYQVAAPGVVAGANNPTGGWVDFNPLDFTSPVFGPTSATALDGNAPANRVALSSTLTVTIQPGQEIWLRWVDIDHPNNDHGLAIDDFSVTPHGTAPGDAAPSVTSTSPANGATNVPAASNIVINFSESITASSSAFTLLCDGVSQGFTPSALSNVTSITLDPPVDLPLGKTCVVTVAKTQITDSDSVDPPDNMADNYTFSFSTPAPDVPPVVTTTSPADNASGVSLNASITIKFSEVVSASPTAFDLECPTGSPVGVTPSASPASTYTLTPATPLPAATVCTVKIAANQVADVDAPIDPMAADYTFSFATANAPPPGAGNVIINEVDADTPGTDDKEFVELYDGGAGNTPLDGLVLVFYNGNGDVSYAAFDLAGYRTNGNGYFTIGNPKVSNVDLTFDPGSAGFLQNGADAVALYVGHAADFPNGTAVTTNNLQDAIVYDTDDDDDPGLLVLLNPDQPQVNENGGGDGQNQSSQRCPNGSGGARNTSTYSQAAPTPGTANVCTPPPPPQNSPVVISQVYGGGGNSGAAYQNDFVELYNKSAATVSLEGWSVQYASASGSGWDTNRQPLGGTIGAGQYYLVALGSNGAVGSPLPAANVTGQINLSASGGKVALADTFDGLVGNCPVGNSPHVMDFVGYGSADCREGLATAPAPGNNATSLVRLGGGAIDTNENGNDFVKGAANPRRTEPIVELGPKVLGTDPHANGVNAPRDATIEVSFTEPVDVLDPWFSILCTSSGLHADATTATANGGRDHYITPNANFTPGETCTVTVAGSRISDQDTDDGGPNTDHLPGDYSWSFSVASGAAPPYPASVHLTMGNPSGADTNPNNYLMSKPEYALSYNRDLGRPNWVSWHLTPEWFGTLTRFDTFRADPQVPPDWYRVQSFDFQGSGFDRGHMTPNADRDLETSIPINQATYLMSNMVAQAPDNNQGPWAAFEGYLRTLAGTDRNNLTNEIYIVAGPAGTGGTGSNGGVTTTLANGHVAVPAATWKIALVLPYGSDDVSRVTCSTRTIAVLMPNTQGIRNDDWTKYLTTVDAIEALTGYDFFSNVSAPIQYCIEAGINGDNPRNPQTITVTAIPGHTYGDSDFAVDASASSGLPVTLAVASGPAQIVNGLVHLTGTGTVALTVSQAGDDTYARADDAPVSFAVAQATPAFTSLSTPSIEMGTPSVLVTGAIAGNGAVPPGAVTITIGAASTTVAIGGDGTFSASLATAALSAAQSPYAITFTFAGDANFTSATAASTLIVVDTTAPAIGAMTASPDVLGVPNHKLFAVSVDYSTSDLSGAPVCALSVASNEPANGTGDGNTAVDWVLGDAHHLQLRAERAGTGSGRVYTITATCTDRFGNAAAKSTTVSVSK